MRLTEIHLSRPFHEIMASLLALPGTRAEADAFQFPDTADPVSRKIATWNAEVRDALWSLYEAANGRQVETQIGFVAIAPPVASFLRESPYRVRTQYEFFLEALSRLLVGDSLHQGRTNRSTKSNRNRRGINARETLSSRSKLRSRRNRLILSD